MIGHGRDLDGPVAPAHLPRLRAGHAITDPESLAVAQWLLREPEPRFFERVPQLVVTQTGVSQTPLPAELVRTMLLDLGTRAHAFPTSAVDDVVRGAIAYARGLAVIPIDAAIDARVETLAV